MVRNQAPIILNNNVELSLHVHNFHHCCCIITEDSFLSLPGLWHPIPGSPCPLKCPSHCIYALTSGAGPPISLPPHLLGLHYLTGLPHLYLVRHPTLGYCGLSISSAYGLLPDSFRTKLFKNKWKGEGAKKDFWLYFILTKISYSLWPK